MRAQAGIHDFLCYNEGNSWMPAFAGMTGAAPGLARPPALPVRHRTQNLPRFH
jgi:hypothetical protein